MIKYCAAALVLKAFSCSPQAKKVYRILGNSIGSKRRAAGKMPDYYLRRVERMLRMSTRLGMPRDGIQLVELGTGWLHWEAITIRLFFDVAAVLYDVWDNRQLNGLKNYLTQLEHALDGLEVDADRRSRARILIAEIQRRSDYRDLYDLLGFQYVVDPDGVLGSLERESFDLVVSAGVLEHVYAKDANELIHGIWAVLKPGGLSIHSINIRDHLHQYDGRVSQKQYLKYPDWIWRVFFENDVQYINKIQRSDWLHLFESAGLKLVDETVDAVDLSGMKVAKPYRNYSKVDQACGGLIIIHRKPRQGRRTAKTEEGGAEFNMGKILTH